MTATSLARAHLRPVIEMELLQDQSVTYTHVDDTNQLVKGSTGQQVVNRAVVCGTRSCGSFADRDLELSDKSEVVASRLWIARAIQRRLGSAGIPIKSARCSEDLGIGAAAGSRRCTAVQKKRLRKARLRAARIGRLANADF